MVFMCIAKSCGVSERSNILATGGPLLSSGLYYGLIAETAMFCCARVCRKYCTVNCVEVWNTALMYKLSLEKYNRFCLECLVIKFFEYNSSFFCNISYKNVKLFFFIRIYIALILRLYNRPLTKPMAFFILLIVLIVVMI